MIQIDEQLWLQVLEDSAPVVRILFHAMGFPTLVTPTYCSGTLHEWICQFTEGDHERMCLWGLSSKLLKVADVEVSRHLLCAAARFWKLAHHVFRFDKVELTPTLEEVRRICGFSTLMGPTIFMRREGYITTLWLLTGLFTEECQKKLTYTSGPEPMLSLTYFDEVAKKRTELGDELWLQGFVTRFLGELVFSHGRMTVAIEVAEIALAMVTRQIDLALVVLVETYRGLDRISYCCRNFHGCGALVQVWLAGHLGAYILHLQRTAFETYCNNSHARIIKSVYEEYERLEKLTDDTVTWRIIPSAAEPFTVFINTCNRRLVVPPGFTGGVEYHPI